MVVLRIAEVASCKQVTSKLVSILQQPHKNGPAGDQRARFLFGSGAVFLMRELDVEVQRLRVAERGLDLRMAQPLLDLVNRHPALEGQRGGRVTEDVRCNMNGDLAAGDDLRDRGFQRLLHDPAVRPVDVHKQRWVVILAAVQVRLQRDFGPL